MNESNPYSASPVSSLTNPASAQPDQSLKWLLFSFEGRIPRRMFWGASLGVGIINIFITVASMMAFGTDSGVTMFVQLITGILGAWIGLAVGVKRWHDRDKSGWWILINFIPIIGAIWSFIETACLRGTEGPNRFGPDPT